MNFVFRMLRFGARRAGVVLACCAAYLLCFALHSVSFGHLRFADGVDWIYLPAGVRLALVLVFPLEAALGITLASMMVAWDSLADNRWFTAAGTGLVSGFAPLLARSLAVNGLGLSANLESLNARLLLVLAGLFGIVNAFLHQAWYWAVGRSGNFLDQVVVMALGDFLGALIVLYLGRWLLVQLDWRNSHR